MKKKTLLFALLGLALASCGGEPASSAGLSSSEASSSASSKESSSTSSEQSSSSSEATSSSQQSSSASSSSGSGSSSSSQSSSSSPSSSSSSSSPSSSSSSSSSVIDLGLKTIAEARAIIEGRDITTNSMGIGVDETVKLTIQGVAIEKFDLVKKTSKFGLDVSTPKKVLIGDGTDCIAVASDALLEKVGQYANRSDSKYTVTGYLSKYFGIPELYSPDKNMFTLNKGLSVSVDYDALVKTSVTASNFFEVAASLPYNCAGNGYGDVIKMEGMTCFYFDAGSNIYYFTDGRNFVKVVKNNVNCSVGSVYDLIGSYSIKDYAPALRLLSVKTSNATPATIDYASASSRSVAELRAIKTDQDDTKTRYPEYTKSYGGLRYADVYFGAAIENSKYYIGIADIAKPNNVTGTKAAMTATSGPMALIDNDGYWNIASKLGSPVGEEVGSENVRRVYYVPESMAYFSGKTCYKIFLVGVE